MLNVDVIISKKLYLVIHLQAKTIIYPDLKPFYHLDDDRPNTHCRSVILPCSTGSLQVMLCWATLSEHPPLKALGKTFTQDITRSLIQRFMISPGINQVSPNWISQEQWLHLIPDLLRKTVHKIQSVLLEQNWQNHIIHAGALLCHAHGQELWWAGQGRISGLAKDQALDAYPHISELNTAQTWHLMPLDLKTENIEILPTIEAIQNPLNTSRLTYGFRLSPVTSKTSVLL